MAATASNKEVGGEERTTRSLIDRAIQENRALSDEDRLTMYRDANYNGLLPDFNIPGYHVCWLTTSNPRDPIINRIRLGYEPVKVEDVPGFEVYSPRSGEWSGFISVNEMLAFKIPNSLHDKYIREAHHDAPRREEEKIISTTDFLRDKLKAAGGDLFEGDGMSAIRSDQRKYKTLVA